MPVFHELLNVSTAKPEWLFCVAVDCYKGHLMDQTQTIHLSSVDDWQHNNNVINICMKY